MSILYGLIYVLYFMVLGYAARAVFNLIAGKKLIIETKTDLLAHALFLGVVIHVILLNILQHIDTSNLSHLWMIVCTAGASISISLWHAFKYGVATESLKPTKSNTSIILLLLAFSVMLYVNSSHIPNIAWDSWLTWVGKADQWVAHGLSVKITNLEGWLTDSSTIFNVSAHYPDGLSLIYWLAKMTTEHGLQVVLTLYLFSFAMMVLLLVKRLRTTGSPLYLQMTFVIVLYTLPLLNSHLLITGYADVWMAMFIVLIMLTFIDYHEKKELGVALTLMGYLAMLPMLKLEGWIWLVLFIMAHVTTILLSHKNKSIYWVLIGLAMIAFWLFGGINLHFANGHFIINSDKIEIFNLINSPLQFTNINDAILTGFFWQNNWSFIWLGLPFLIITFFTRKHLPASQVSHIFLILALACYMFLFYFTKASQWAQDLTALNRLVLQLTPSYVFLLFIMLIGLKGVSTNQQEQPQ